MFLVWALLVAAAVSNASGKRIVGGEETTIQEYPAIVQVEFVSGSFWSQSCAGNIISRTHVLSAAHCFAGFFFQLSSRRFRAGATNRHTSGVIVYLSQRLNHPSYGSNGADADISLLTLSTPLTLTDVIQPVSIPVQGFELPDNLPVVHAGWGTIRSGGPMSAVLQHVEINTINHDLCYSRYQARPFGPLLVTRNMICAGVLDVGGKDACQGDSGGPLYYIDPNHGQVLVGLVSWGEGCAHQFYPGVSTKVSPYTYWIGNSTSTL